MKTYLAFHLKCDQHHPMQWTKALFRINKSYIPASKFLHIEKHRSKRLD